MINQPDEIYVFKTNFKLIFKVFLRSVKLGVEKWGPLSKLCAVIKIRFSYFYHFQLQHEHPYSQSNPPWLQEGHPGLQGEPPGLQCEPPGFQGEPGPLGSPGLQSELSSLQWSRVSLH
jgi:hypothetical protein